MYFFAIKWSGPVRIFLFLFLLWQGPGVAQEIQLSARERDEIRSSAITLVNDFEKLLNVIATKGTTSSDVQDLVQQTTSEEGRLFFDNKINVEDDLHALNADSGTAKDVNIVKYLNDWDLFYTKSYSEAVVFSDLRLSEFQQKDYLFLKVYYQAQYKTKHKDFDKPYPDRKRIALIRVDKKGDKWEAAINALSFFRGIRSSGVPYTPETFEEDFKPFVKEKKARLVSTGDGSDSSMVAQASLQRRSDSLYAAAVKENLQRSEEQKKKDEAYNRAVNRADSLLAARQFPAALEAYTEARSFRPIELYPRTRIKELTKILADGTADPRELAAKQEAEGDRLFKVRAYEEARQSFMTALNILPDNQGLRTKIAQVDKVLRNKSEIRSRYMAGNFKGALKEYGKVIAEDKNNPDYYLERGRCYQAMGDGKKALLDFNKALELDPNFEEALQARALIYQKNNQLVQAISDYTTLLAIDSKNAEYPFRRGVLSLQNNDLESAISDFQNALKINPKDIQSLVFLSESLRRKGQLDEAISQAEAAVAINPSISGGHYQKGLALLDKNEEEKAAQLFSKAIRLGLNEEQEKGLEKIHSQYFAKAKDADSKGATQEALALVKRAIAVKPKSAEAYYFLGMQHEKLKKYSEAIQALDQATFLKEDFAAAFLKKGQILLQLHDWKRVPPSLIRVLQIDRKNLDAAMGLGDAYMGLGDLDSAMSWFGEALIIRPNSAEALVKRGKAHFVKENYVRSLMDFDEAIRLDKKRAEAHFFRGRINKALRQYEKAIDNFDEALQLGYSKYECAVEVGSSYALLGSHGKAVKYFNNAIKEDPNQGKAFALRGLSHLAEENYKEALADLDEAVKMDTAQAKVGNRIELGFLKLRFNDYGGAEDQFNKALDLDPYHPRGNYGLAVTQFMLGKTELSMRTFEQAFIPRKLDYDVFRKDPWMKPILKDKAFKKLLKAYFDK